MAERVVGNWSPLHWEPEVWPGSAFFFTARLHGLPPGEVTGGTMFLDGQAFSVRVDADTLRVHVPEDQTASIALGGSARIYLDTGAGRVLWLNGSVSGGGN